MILKASPNYDARRSGYAIDMLIFHYTGMRSGSEALSRLSDPKSKVSAHYLIQEDGKVVNLVKEMYRAWHAGVSFWQGERDINSLSIGIELVNPGHEFGYRNFSNSQMEVLCELSLDIMGRYQIPADRILGHADVAPARKKDPGELFDWRRLADSGVGVWPQTLGEGLPVVEVPTALADYGYGVLEDGLKPCAIAFQRHWRPLGIDGIMDWECRRILKALLDERCIIIGK